MARPTKRRRTNGGVSFHKTHKKWCFNYRVGNKRKFGYANTKAEAEAKLNRILVMIADGMDTLTDPVFQVYAEDWLEMKDNLGKVAPATISKYAYELKRIYEYVGHMKLSKIKAAHLENLYADLLKKGKSPNYVRSIATTFSIVWGHAFKHGIVRQNIAAIAERPKKVNTIPEMLDIEDILKVIAASRKVKNYGGLVIEFIFKTGMRHSEALKTTWDRIDFDKGTVRVGQSKNESSSNRIILLDKELLDLLKLHQKEQQSNVDTEDLKKKFNPMGYVFCNSAGNLQNRSNVWRDIWKPLRKSLGIDEKMTVHDLRHNCASYLLQDPETSIPVVSAWLGHKTPKTTMEIYAHILPNDLELGRNAMSKLSINRG